MRNEHTHDTVIECSTGNISVKDLDQNEVTNSDS